MNPYFPFVFLNGLRENNTMFYMKTHQPVNGQFMYLSYPDKRIMRREAKKNGCFTTPVYLSPEKSKYTSVFTLVSCPIQACGSSKNKIQKMYTLATTNSPLFGGMAEYQKQKEFMFSIPWISMVYFGCKEQGITNPASYSEWINIDGRNVWILRDTVQDLYLSLIGDKITLGERQDAIELMFEPIRQWPDHYYLDFPWLKCEPKIGYIENCSSKSNEEACKDRFGSDWTVYNSEKCEKITCYRPCIQSQVVKSQFQNQNYTLSTLKDRLEMGDELKNGQELISMSGNTRLVNNGKSIYLIGHRGTGNGWTLHWILNSSGTLRLNDEGNLVLVNNQNNTWNSNTSGTNVSLIVQDNGLLEMYDSNTKIASTHLFGGNVKRLDGDARYLRPLNKTRLDQLEELSPGDNMYSKDIRSIIQNLGRSFVISVNNKIIWNNTYNEPISLCMTPEGTLNVVGLDTNQVLSSFGINGSLHYAEISNQLMIKDVNNNIVFAFP